MARDVETEQRGRSRRPFPPVGVRVAVDDVIPASREGLAAAIRLAGLYVEEPANPLAWAKATPGVLVVVGGAERLLGRLRAKRERLRAHVVGLVDAVTRDIWITAIAEGAAGVLTREAATADSASLVRLVSCAGQTVVPVELARQLATAISRSPTGGDLDQQRRAWLERLGEGASVREVAREAAHSERAMHRSLQALYCELGVDNRHQAVREAARLGLI